MLQLNILCVLAGFASIKSAGKPGAKKRSAAECYEANAAVVQKLSTGWLQQPGSDQHIEHMGSSLKLLLLLALQQSVKGEAADLLSVPDADRYESVTSGWGRLPLLCHPLHILACFVPLMDCAFQTAVTI